MTHARRLSVLSVFALAAATNGVRAASAQSPAPAGRYVEARTASVFAGACHYNGERVTEGKSAVAVWSIDRGGFDGVDLTNARVVAVIGSDENLADDAPRRTTLTIDAPTPAARSAALAWVRTRAAARLGDVVGVRHGPVAFAATADETRVDAPGFASLVVRPMPDAACCSQPHLVWYTPLAAVEGRRVGHTVSAASTATPGDRWQRADENSAFYGRFGDATTAVAVNR